MMIRAKSNWACIALSCFTSHPGAQEKIQGRALEMSGYLLMPKERGSQEFDAGFSLYSTAWPLLETYPGQMFQSGLFGTWMYLFYE